MIARLRSYSPQIALVVGAALVSWACAGSSEGEAETTTLSSIIESESTAAPDAAPDTAPVAPPTAASTSMAPETTGVPATDAPEAPTTRASTTEAPVTTAAPVAPLEIDETSFVALSKMTPVRGFFVDNLLGDIDATVAIAESPVGGVYPMGSVVQLIPGEVMVKREAGFSPTTNDWEFFELDVDATGNTIRVRGGDEVINRFGLSCATCHALAAPQWDFICEQDHGCDPLPFDRETIEAIQASDPRT